MPEYLATIRSPRKGTRIGNVPVVAANRTEARKELRRVWWKCHVLNLRLRRRKADYYAFERRWGAMFRPAIAYP